MEVTNWTTGEPYKVDGKTQEKEKDTDAWFLPSNRFANVDDFLDGITPSFFSEFKLVIDDNKFAKDLGLCYGGAHQLMLGVTSAIGLISISI